MEQRRNILVDIENHLVVTVEKGKGVRARKGRRLRDANYCVPNKLDTRTFLTTQETEPIHINNYA